MNKLRIASIEDDESISLIISKTLEKQGFEVLSYSDGESFLDDVGKNTPGLILLDLMLPNIQGREVLKQIRKIRKYDDIRVIVVSAKSMTSDKVELLDLGADDYLTKPFEITELISRVKAQFRRNPNATKIKKGRFSYDADRNVFCIRNKPVELTSYELLIARRLLEADGRIVTREELTASYSNPKREDSKALDMLIRSLRKKLGPDSIKSIYGSGYRLVL